MTAFILGIIVGFLMCIPVGPINFWVVNTLLKHNFRSAFSIALGGSLMDFVYFIVILSGLSFFTLEGKTSLVLKITGVFFLFAFGLRELLAKDYNLSIEKSATKKIPHSSSFFALGILIYTSNPTLIASMSALAAVIKSWHIFDNTFLNFFFLSLGISLGSAIWFYFLLRLVQKYQNKIPQKFFLNFGRISGVFIILFSLFMAFNVYKEMYL